MEIQINFEKKILEFWILKNNTAIFKYGEATKVTPDIFHSVVMALNDVVSNFENGTDISGFTLGNKNYLLRRIKDIIFIIAYPLKLKISKAEKALYLLSEKFNAQYPPGTLDHWNGNEVFFNWFIHDIKNYDY